MKGGNFAKKYVVKLIQERWFLNFTFHKGTCIVRRASRLHFYRVFLAVRSNFHWSVRQEFIPLMTHFLILMVIISLDVHGRQLIFLRSPLLFFFNMGDKHQRHIKFKGYVRVCYCPGLLLFIKVITFYWKLDHWGKCVFIGLAIKGYEPYTIICTLWHCVHFHKINPGRFIYTWDV